jgi:long-chain acyl-CoA synthetase
MKGYYKRDDETAKVMLPDGGFKTGDMGYIDQEGYLHITGRVKEQFKLENGKYVAPAPLEEHLKLSPFMAQVFIHGANKPHNVALIVLNAENMPGWAEQNGLGGKPMAELAKEPKVRQLIQGEIARLSGDFKGFEKVQNFLLLPEEFTTENGMLTPSMKIKRNIVVEKFKDTLESLYSKDSSGA